LAAPLAFADLAVQLAQSMVVAREDGGEIGGGHGCLRWGKGAHYSGAFVVGRGA